MAGNSNSKIEQVIDDLEIFIDNCKFQALSSTKIIVNKEEIDEYIRQLRMNTPDEIKRYERIIANRDDIISDAKNKAQALIDKANEQSAQMLDENEIMQQAYAESNEIVEQAIAQAQQILDQAMNEANNLKESAVEYVDSIMANVQDVMRDGMNKAQRSFDDMMGALENTGELLGENRRELREGPSEEPAPVVSIPEPEAVQE